MKTNGLDKKEVQQNEGEKYILHEEYAPDEFVIATDVEFEVTYGKETQEIVLIDKRVEITKTDFDIIADKYKILFKQALIDLEDIAGSMPILSEELTGHKDIRKINVRNYIIFYIVDEEKSKAFFVRIGHAFMDWEKYLKNN